MINCTILKGAEIWHHHRQDDFQWLARRLCGFHSLNEDQCMVVSGRAFQWAGHKTCTASICNDNQWHAGSDIVYDLFPSLEAYFHKTLDLDLEPHLDRTTFICQGVKMMNQMACQEKLTTLCREPEQLSCLCHYGTDKYSYLHTQD